MRLQLRLAWRYLTGRRLRTVLTTLAISFGVMVLGLGGITSAVQGSFRQSLMAAAGQVDLTVTSETRGVFAAGLVERVRSVPGVAQATGSLVRTALLPASLAPSAAGGKQLNTLSIHGVDPATVAQVRPLLLAEGRLLRPDDRSALLVTAGLAAATGLRPGDRLALPSATGTAEFEVVGIVASRPAAEAEEVYVALAAAQALFNLPGAINTIEANVAPDSEAEEVGQAVLATLGSGFKLGGHAVGAELLSMLQVSGTVFSTLGVLTIIMGGFIILITFRTIVVERRVDIGMLRAVGASRRTILGLIVGEGLLQGAAGTAIGLVAGQLLVRAALAALEPTWEGLLGFPLAHPSFSLRDLALAIGLGLGVTLLAALRPALIASRVPPLEALRPALGAVTWKAAGKRGLWGLGLIGLALLGLATGNMGLTSIGVVLFLVGLIAAAPLLVLPISRVLARLLALALAREGAIAQGNVVRQPGRAATTASTMMIGLAIVLAFASLISSMTGSVWDYMRRSLGSDYLLMPHSLMLGGGNVGAGPELAQAVRSTPGIAAVTSLRLGTARLGKQDLQVVGVDPTGYPQLAGLSFSAGEPEEAFAALAGERALIVNGILASQSGVRVGQTLTLATPAGPQAYRIVGIASDYLNFKLATAYISQANLAQDFQETSDLLLLANRAADASPDAVYEALQGVAAGYPAFALYSTEVFQRSQQQTFGAMVQALHFLALVLAVPSLIALVNTLAIGVLERRREIGMLRAVGATRGQVRRMILGESLLLAAIGTAFGILAGLWLGYVLIAAMGAKGLSFPYSFPSAGLLLTLAAGLIFGVAGALIPARQAARLNVVAALQYE